MLQLQEVVAVPCDEPGSLVREVHAPEGGLAATEKRLTHRVVVRPHEEVVDGDIFKHSDVTIRAEHLLVAPCGDDHFRVHCLLSSVQSIDEGTPLSGVQRLNISSD